MQGIAQKVMADPGKYSIQQLQQAVERGILPAYVGIPLIQEKVQQQKQMQMAQQAQAAPAQGPTIAQRVMQEAQGVASLPTGLPQEYAHGGIVAFEDGGPVERYQSDGLVRPRGIYPYNAPEAGRFKYSADETPEERRRREFLATREGREAQARADRAGLLALPAAAGDVLLGGPVNAASAVTENLANAIGVPRIGRALGIYDPDVTSVEVPRIGTGTATPFFDKLRQYASGQPAPAAPARTPAAINTDLGPVPGTSDSTSILGGFADARTGNVGGPGQGLRTDRPTKPGVTPGASMFGLKPPTLKAPEGRSFEDIYGKQASDYSTYARNLDVGAEAEKAAAREKVKGEAFDEYKKSLEAEAKQSGADRDQAKYMSLFKAGLAMMAGTSRHALENIGKGAMVGADDYQAAVKDLKKADKERQKELAHIEQARRAETLGDRDTAVREADAARDRADARARYTTEAITRGTALDRSTALDLAKTQFSSESDIFRTDLAGRYQLAAARESAEAKLAAALARTGGRGGMNQKQIGDTILQLQQSPEAAAYRKQLLDQKGKNAANTPEFKQAMDQFVMGLFNKYYGGQLGGGSGAANLGQADLDLVRKYLAQ